MQLAQRSHETHFSLSPRQVKYAICKINQRWCSTHRKIGCSHTLETSFLHKHSSTSIKEILPTPPVTCGESLCFNCFSLKKQTKHLESFTRETRIFERREQNCFIKSVLSRIEL